MRQCQTPVGELQGSASSLTDREAAVDDTAIKGRKRSPAEHPLEAFPRFEIPGTSTSRRTSSEPRPAVAGWASVRRAPRHLAWNNRAAIKDKGTGKVSKFCQKCLLGVCAWLFQGCSQARRGHLVLRCGRGSSEQGVPQIKLHKETSPYPCGGITATGWVCGKTARARRWAKPSWDQIACALPSSHCLNNISEASCLHLCVQSLLIKR